MEGGTVLDRQKNSKGTFCTQQSVNEKFNDLKAEVCDDEKITICFEVEEKIYPLALEAMLDEREDYRMLNLPLFRSVKMSGLNRQKSNILFVDNVKQRPPINCLIIAADAAGYVVDAKINRGRRVRPFL